MFAFFQASAGSGAETAYLTVCLRGYWSGIVVAVAFVAATGAVTVIAVEVAVEVESDPADRSGFD